MVGWKGVGVGEIHQGSIRTQKNRNVASSSLFLNASPTNLRQHSTNNQSNCGANYKDSEEHGMPDRWLERI